MYLFTYVSCRNPTQKIPLNINIEMGCVNNKNNCYNEYMYKSDSLLYML